MPSTSKDRKINDILLIRLNTFLVRLERKEPLGIRLGDYYIKLAETIKNRKRSIENNSFGLTAGTILAHMSQSKSLPGKISKPKKQMDGSMPF